MSIGKNVCSYCHLNRTKEDHDGCLGELNGVMNACCGHGDNELAYVQFLDGSIIQKDDALKIMKIMKNTNVTQPEMLINAREVRRAVQREYEGGRRVN